MKLNKSDPALGMDVHEHLKKVGVETPMNYRKVLDDEGKVERLNALFEQILDELGMDRNDDSIEGTPMRLAKMYPYELMWGMDYRNFPKCTAVDNKMKYDEMVFENDITVKSLCEHHLIPIVGYAHIAYIPKDKVLGLSKLNRITEFFSRRPQIQERLAEQIYHTLQYILGTDDIAVVIKAKHLCVSHRGVNDNTSMTVTSKLGGEFRDHPEVRAEFMNLINGGK
jgi:GTP cyclohydrolase I